MKKDCDPMAQVRKEKTFIAAVRNRGFGFARECELLEPVGD